MTQLLEEAIAKLQQLPPQEQDAMAQLILDELAAEQQWDQAFALAGGVGPPCCEGAPGHPNRQGATLGHG